MAALHLHKAPWVAMVPPLATSGVPSTATVTSPPALPTTTEAGTSAASSRAQEAAGGLYKQLIPEPGLTTGER